MTPVPLLHRLRAAVALSVAALLAACAATAPEAPEAPPAGRPIEDFAAGLQCMDDLLLDHGVRDLALAPVEPPDSGGKQSVVAREQLQAVLAAMSRRSGAIRLAAEPAGAKTAGGWAVQGAVQRPEGGTRAVALTLLSAQDRSVVPGISGGQRASVRGGYGEIRRFGQSFVVPAAKGDGPVVRALVEASSIELVGRLAKVPYWTCLGGDPEHPEVEAEVRDWYDTLAARPKELIAWFQTQLRVRGLYGGPADGVVNPATKDAVARYREALGLSREPKLTHDFLKAYLRADHRQIAARNVAAAPGAAQAAAPATAAPPAQTVQAAQTAPPAAPAQAPAAAGAPLALRVGTGHDARAPRKGERIELELRPSRDAYVYCFHQDEHRQIRRFFPNRFQADPRVSAAGGLQLPGAMRFELRMNAQGLKEAVSCFATERDVLASLPAEVGGSDFAPLPLTSLDQVREAFVRASAGTLGHELLPLQPR